MSRAVGMYGVVLVCDGTYVLNVMTPDQPLARERRHEVDDIVGISVEYMNHSYNNSTIAWQVLCSSAEEIEVGVIGFPEEYFVPALALSRWVHTKSSYWADWTYGVSASFLEV